MAHAEKFDIEKWSKELDRKARKAYEEWLEWLKRNS